MVTSVSLTPRETEVAIDHTLRHLIKEWADAKKGAVSYKVPVFEAVPLTDAEKAEAVALDQELQAYFAEYFNYTPDSHSEAVGLTQDVVIDDIDDGPIDLSEIPF